MKSRRQCIVAFLISIFGLWNILIFLFLSNKPENVRLVHAISLFDLVVFGNVAGANCFTYSSICP